MSEDSPSSETQSDFDFSQVNPKEEWVCYGQFENGHDECMECPVRTDCAQENG